MIKLTNYLNKIEAKYTLAREKWEAVQKEMAQEEERFSGINWNIYSNDGRNEEFRKHNETKSELINKLKQIRSDFELSIKEVVKGSDKVFNRRYGYTPRDVDSNGVAILQNCTLSDSELIDLAESYRNSGNYTMYYMVSEKLKKDKEYGLLSESEKKAHTYYVVSQSSKARDDHRILEDFGEVCLKALRDEDFLSNGIHKHHDEFYQNFKGEADEIAVESAWDE